MARPLEEVLAIRVGRAKSIGKIANSILSIGSWKDFEIFSVDPRPAQRFLHDMGVRPFSRVLIDGGKICALGSDSMDSQDLPPSERRPCWLIAETLSARDLHQDP